MTHNPWVGKNAKISIHQLNRYWNWEKDWYDKRGNSKSFSILKDVCLSIFKFTWDLEYHVFILQNEYFSILGQFNGLG